MLTRHDKSTADVAVFHKPLTVWLVQNAGHFKRDIAGGFRDGDHHVNVQVFPLTGDFLTQLGSHANAGAVDGNFVQERVRSGKIDVLKQARIAFRVLCTLTREQLTFLGDVNRFARRNITQEFEAERIQRHAFRGNHILMATVFHATLTNHQRTDAVRIAERNHTMTDDHRHAGIGATNVLMNRCHSGENVVCFQREMLKTIQLLSKDIEQDFRI